jgi:sigma-B regulation protein RsbU (phosphoserine phosphatase)
MGKSKFKELWENSPSAMILIEGEKIINANPSFIQLIEEKSEISLVENPEWVHKYIKDKEKFYNFMQTDAEELNIDLSTAKNNYRRVRVLKKDFDENQKIVVFQNITIIYDHTQTFKAGYDEFLRVTLELEQAVAIIKNQKEVLEQQKNTLETELRIAHILQEGLFKEDFNKYKLLNISGYYMAMEALGGDMWEIFETESEVFVVLGDVMGHGVASSLISIIAKTLFKKKFEELSGRKDERVIKNILDSINRDLIHVTGQNYFITAVVVRINKSYRMDFATAGHPPIIIVTPNEKLITLHLELPMLGVFDSPKFRSKSLQLSPGSRVFMYTDCLIEGGRDNDTIFSLEEIGSVIREFESEPLDLTLEKILELRKEKAGKEQLPDDLAMICMEVPAAS